jgi:hypothetical protein
MNIRLGLIISSTIVGSLLTVAAAPALASPLDSAREIADNVTAANNSWGSPCSIDFTNHTAVTNGACLFTLSLRDDDATITAPQVAAWWGSSNPSAVVYFNQITAGNHFTNISDATTIQEGDLIAVKTSSTAGYLFLVDVAPIYVADVVRDNATYSRYFVSIIDSISSSPHGPTDSRWFTDVGPTGLAAHDQGVGSGDIYIDVDVDGAIAAHTWSTVNGGTLYTAAARPVAVGRFVR